MPHDPRPTNPLDYRRARVLTILVLLALVSFGTCANIVSGRELFSSVFLVALLTGICALLGVSFGVSK